MFKLFSSGVGRTHIKTACNIYCSTQSHFTVKSTIFLIIPLLLTGCLSTPTKLSDSARPQLKTLKLVAMEAPPLEVVPDLLETRMPVYAHYANMALPVSTESKIYRHPGGIQIAGRVGEGDTVEIVTTTDQANDWMPTEVLLQEAIAQLRVAHLRVKPERVLRRLPMSRRDADLVRWRDAIERWYGRDKLKGDAVPDKADAVLELGIGQYKIFAGQLSLQVLIKLIEPKTGKVIARVDEKSVDYEAPIPVLLDREGAKFKSLLRRSAARLLAQGFRDMGLTS